MFGLSKKEVLVKAIKNACNNELQVYKTGAIKLASMQSSDEDIDKMVAAIRREYLNSVFDAIWASFRASSPTIETKMRLAMMSPSITGLPEEFDIEYFDCNGISAGCTFAIAYYALTGKSISNKEYKTCSMLNHYQNDLMQNVLVDLANTQQI